MPPRLRLRPRRLPLSLPTLQRWSPWRPTRPPPAPAPAGPPRALARSGPHPAWMRPPPGRCAPARHQTCCQRRPQQGARRERLLWRRGCRRRQTLRSTRLHRCPSRSSCPRLAGAKQQVRSCRSAHFCCCQYLHLLFFTPIQARLLHIHHQLHQLTC